MEGRCRAFIRHCPKEQKAKKPKQKQNQQLKPHQQKTPTAKGKGQKDRSPVAKADFGTWRLAAAGSVATAACRPPSQRPGKRRRGKSPRSRPPASNAHPVPPGVFAFFVKPESVSYQVLHDGFPWLPTIVTANTGMGVKFNQGPVGGHPNSGEGGGFVSTNHY